MCKEDILGALIGLARATEGNEDLITDETNQLVLESLRATANHGNLKEEELTNLLERLDAEKKRLVPDCYICQAPCGRNNNYDMGLLVKEEDNIRALKKLILLGVWDIARNPVDKSKMMFLYKALYVIGLKDCDQEYLLEIALETGVYL